MTYTGTSWWEAFPERRNPWGTRSPCPRGSRGLRSGCSPSTQATWWRSKTWEGRGGTISWVGGSIWKTDKLHISWKTNRKYLMKRSLPVVLHLLHYPLHDKFSAVWIEIGIVLVLFQAVENGIWGPRSLKNRIQAYIRHAIKLNIHQTSFLLTWQLTLFSLSKRPPGGSQWVYLISRMQYQHLVLTSFFNHTVVIG